MDCGRELYMYSWERITCAPGQYITSFSFPYRTTKNNNICIMTSCPYMYIRLGHDDDIKWKHFPRYWPFVRGIHRGPVNSPHKGQWHGALMFSLICVWKNGWVNNREAGDLSPHGAHYDATVMDYVTIARAMNRTKVTKETIPVIKYKKSKLCLWRINGTILLPLIQPNNRKWILQCII